MAETRVIITVMPSALVAAHHLGRWMKVASLYESLAATNSCRFVVEFSRNKSCCACCYNDAKVIQLAPGIDIRNPYQSPPGLQTLPGSSSMVKVT